MLKFLLISQYMIEVSRSDQYFHSFLKVVICLNFCYLGQCGIWWKWTHAQTSIRWDNIEYLVLIMLKLSVCNKIGISVAQLGIFTSLLLSTFLLFYPITPKSDWHLISPYNVSPDSHIKVTRIKEMITN